MILEERIKQFLSKHKLKAVRKIAHGFAAEVHEVKNARGKRFALKIERDKSRRRDFVHKETEYLKKANSVQVGPALISSDYENKAILMEFIDGEPFYRWVLEKNPSKKKLKHCLQSLLMQAFRLDSIGLDHGQLAGKGKNILVTKSGEPVIIDFEKASLVRRVHNQTQLQSFLFQNPNSAIAQKIREILKS